MWSGPSIGQGQAWQNVIGSRALTGVYTNITGKPIMVSVSVQTATVGWCYVTLIVGGVTVGMQWSGAGGYTQVENMMAIIPAGTTYTTSYSGSTCALAYWAELR